MQLTFLGHASFMLETDGFRILIDPFISPNELAQQALAENPDLEDLLNPEKIKADFILITHGHQDHVVDAATVAQANEATIISSYEIVTWYGEQGLKGHPLNHGGKAQFPFATVKYVNAIHSSVLPDGTYGGNPGGFVLWNDEGCLYIAGDTALTWDMKLIPMTCPKLDMAIFPVGDNFTMGFEDAVIASDFVECNRIIGCHYDTFPPIVLDKEAALAAFSQQSKTLLLPAIGEVVSL